MAEGQIRFLIFYVAFFLAVAYFGAIIPSATGLGVDGGDVATLPELDDSNLTIINYLLFVFDWVVYFFGLQGLAIAGIPAVIAGLIGVVLDTILVYVAVRLARGGG